MKNRARARELAAEYLAKGNPTDWFEALYREAEQGQSHIPWADLCANPSLLDFWEQHSIPTANKTALVVGSGFGDDAEQLAAWGFQTTAFDIAPSAIRTCRQRFPASKVNYVVADLLNAPPQWRNDFDLVFEAYTLQVLPRPLRAQAITYITGFLSKSAHLLLIARGREEQDPEGQMPWPLTRSELESLKHRGLQKLSFDDYVDNETPPVRRFRGFYRKLGQINF